MNRFNNSQDGKDPDSASSMKELGLLPLIVYYEMAAFCLFSPTAIASLVTY